MSAVSRCTVAAVAVNVSVHLASQGWPMESRKDARRSGTMCTRLAAGGKLVG
jgi:tetrahydromethanopterin S-methyltransferase subunit D